MMIVEALLRLAEVMLSYEAERSARRAALVEDRRRELREELKRRQAERDARKP